MTGFESAGGVIRRSLLEVRRRIRVAVGVRGGMLAGAAAAGGAGASPAPDRGLTLGGAARAPVLLV